VDTARFHTQEGRLEEGLRATETLVTDRDHLTVGKFVGLLEGSGGGSGSHFLLEVQSDVAELLLDVTDDFSLSCVRQKGNALLRILSSEVCLKAVEGIQNEGRRKSDF